MLRELDLHITNRCTTACSYCCFSSNRTVLPELSTDELFQIINDAIELGCDHIHFTGGEPLLREDLLKLIRYTTNQGVDVRLQTNGMLLTSSMAKHLVSAGLESIMISLDSDRPDEHDKLRGSGTWSLAVDAIKIAQNAGLNVRINSVLTKVNCDRILPVILFSHQLGICTYSAFYFSPIGSGKYNKELWIEPENYLHYWEKLTKEIRLFTKLCDMDIVIEKGYANWEEAETIDTSNFTGCGGGCQNTCIKRDYLIVRCDGNVYPCIMGIDDVPLGNLRANTLHEIHSSSKVWEKLLPTSDPYCDNCEHYKLCAEGCRYYPQEQKGHDIRCIRGKLVPLCPIMKYNTQKNVIGGSSDDVISGVWAHEKR